MVSPTASRVELQPEGLARTPHVGIQRFDPWPLYYALRDVSQV